MLSLVRPQKHSVNVAIKKNRFVYLLNGSHVYVIPEIDIGIWVRCTCQLALLIDGLAAIPKSVKRKEAALCRFCVTSTTVAHQAARRLTHVNKRTW